MCFTWSVYVFVEITCYFVVLVQVQERGYKITIIVQYYVDGFFSKKITISIVGIMQTLVHIKPYCEHKKSFQI